MEGLRMIKNKIETLLAELVVLSVPFLIAYGAYWVVSII